MDRHPFESAAARSQSFSASAISCVKPLTPLQSPAELERKHSQIRRKSSGIFGPKPALKCPRIAQTTSVFSKLQSALRYDNLRESLDLVVIGFLVVKNSSCPWLM